MKLLLDTCIWGGAVPELRAGGLLAQQPATGTFIDLTQQSGTGLDANGMRRTVADFDNDGLLDRCVTSIYTAGLPPTLPGPPA